MKIQIGEFLISGTGEYYRVIEATETYVSLMHVSGYTLFSCRPFFIEHSFRPAPCPPIAQKLQPMQLSACRIVPMFTKKASRQDTEQQKSRAVI